MSDLFWLSIAVGGVCLFAMGWELGRAVGMNDGLRRAHEIMTADRMREDGHV